MNTSTGRTIVKIVVLAVIAVALIAAALACFRMKPGKTGNEPLETTTYEIGERFDSLSLHIGAADVVLAPSEDGGCRVVCHDRKSVQYTAEVRGGVLTVETKDSGKLINTVSMERAQVTVYLTESAYTALKISVGAGDVELPQDFTFQQAELSVDAGNVRCAAPVVQTLRIDNSVGSVQVSDCTVGALETDGSAGRVTLSSVNCGSLHIGGSTGSVRLEHVTAEMDMRIERSTGDITLDDCDAGEIFISTDTGDVTASLRSGKLFTAESDTGKVSVPSSEAGGRCEISTDTGDITVTVPAG